MSLLPFESFTARLITVQLDHLEKSGDGDVLLSGAVQQERFHEWTADGHLRHSKFAGLRDDKDPRQVVREGQTV
jgi:ATP-dependent DNA ligase